MNDPRLPQRDVIWVSLSVVLVLATNLIFLKFLQNDLPQKCVALFFLLVCLQRLAWALGLRSAPKLARAMLASSVLWLFFAAGAYLSDFEKTFAYGMSLILAGIVVHFIFVRRYVKRYLKEMDQEAAAEQQG